MSELIINKAELAVRILEASRKVHRPVQDPTQALLMLEKSDRDEAIRAADACCEYLLECFNEMGVLIPVPPNDSDNG